MVLEFMPLEFVIREEYPTGKNLRKLELIDFPIKDFIVATRSFEEFKELVGNVTDEVKGKFSPVVNQTIYGVNN